MAVKRRVDTLTMWVVGHVTTVWPFAALGAILLLSWSSLERITVRDFRAALHGLDATWLAMAVLATAANLLVMGAYDAVAFAQTRTTTIERWRFGVVAFAWSNFLTLGPLAGPAIRFWLYSGTTDDPTELRRGVVSVSIAFTSGLAAWGVATWVCPFMGVTLMTAVPAVFGLTILIIAAASTAISRWQTRPSHASARRLVVLGLIGWLDWLFAACAFVACVRAAGASAPLDVMARAFFAGQAIGLASLVPGGFGSSDAYWITHLGMAHSAAAAALTAYRGIYYVAPWAVASLALLAWAAERTPQRGALARRMVGGLVGLGGVLIMLSSASPALHARLVLLRALVPLPLVETGQLTAAFAGLLLIALARGLARGYRVAFRASILLLVLAGIASILKGLDWEEALILAGVGIIAASQRALFDRPSHGDVIQPRDVTIWFAAVAAFAAFGALAYHVGPRTFEHWSYVGYGFQAARFLRTTLSLACAVLAAAAYVAMRAPIGFRRLDDDEIDATLAEHAQLGAPDTNPMLVATGDKAVFRDGSRGFCLYRTIGPYLVVFSDPVVASPADRIPFLDALVGFAAECDRRLVLYQVSLDWIPALHDHGHHFFKLGEQANIPLDRITLDGHAGKLYRQLLRRAEREAIRFRVLAPAEAAARIDELADVSEAWLRDKQMTERQFSMGFFEETYMARFRCAIVEEACEGGRLLGFANLLEGPNREELSVDLMRYRSGGPAVMDFLLASMFLEGKRQGYQRFNLGMAPLASVGERRSAHLHERAARLVFERGDQWYNFQGLRQYKQKFHPEWVPRYMAYQAAWEWPIASAYVSALIAGGWGTLVRPQPQPATEPHLVPQPIEA